MARWTERADVHGLSDAEMEEGDQNISDATCFVFQHPASGSSDPNSGFHYNDRSPPMPKIAKERTEQNRRRIEAAALHLFTRQGFHGTNNREIAQKLGISTGTIYTYFSTKEAIYDSVARRYRSHLSQWLKQPVGHLKDPLSKEGLKALACAIQSEMNAEPESFLLLLSDVIEFKNRHFLQVFHDVPHQLRRAIGAPLEQVKHQPGWRGGDPAFVLASAYLYFFTYFLMERHMQGEQHLAVTDEQATEQFIDLLSHGLWKKPPKASGDSDRQRAPSFAKESPLHQAERDRVEYLRFLSGRLWTLPPDVPLSAANGGGHLRKRPLLFVPEVPANRIDENQLRIEAAALDLFTKHGFHATNIRDIARKAGVSQGAIYLFYASKEAIFGGLVQNYRRSMRQLLERVFRAMPDPFSKSGLRLFAAAMRSIVYDDAEYWLLMYIDVLEFQSRHFLKVFQDVPGLFRRLLGPAADQVKRERGWCGQDPALMMAMIYFYFHTYFVIERLMHGDRHLGLDDDEVIERFIDILSHGVWRRPVSAAHH
jgi:AcrR family transcriptional regulator